jgi:DNA-binding CsgD family transcriptional regulator
MALAEPAALVIITDIAPPMNVRSNWLQDIFDFTPAELRVAEWLVQGMGDDLIAHELGIAVSTARTHIKSILGKTQTRSKAELAHLLTMIVR